MYKSKFTFEFAHSTGRGLITIDVFIDAKDKFAAEKNAIIIACSQLNELKNKNLLFNKTEEYEQSKKQY